MKLLITGGAGFIGSNFIRYILRKYPDYQIVNLDLLTYAGNLENLNEVENHPHYGFIRGDICNRDVVDSIVAGNIDTIVNFAAETHVDRSISHPEIFTRTNMMGTQVLLEAARKYNLKKYVQISTDEVYGSQENAGYFREETPLAANNPYAASKAGADLLVRAYHKTFGLWTNILRSSNNYGPYQFPEKLIPLIITNALEGKELPVYGDGENIRDWLHVEDFCVAIDRVLHHGKPGEVYNIGGNNQWKNIDIVKELLFLLNMPESLIRFVHDRPGHDRRYATDAEKIRAQLGWKPTINFDTGLQQTVNWYRDNLEWWRRAKSKKGL